MAGRCVMPGRRRVSVRRVIGLLAGVLTLGSPAAGNDLAASLSAAEADLLRAVNDYRAARGLPRWVPDAGLASIARAHSADMLQRQTLSHEGFTARARRTGSHLCVENLVGGAASAEVAVAAWRKSPDHHANLLDPQVKWAGIGVAGPYATLLACATPVPPVVEFPPIVNRP